MDRTDNLEYEGLEGSAVIKDCPDSLPRWGKAPTVQPDSSRGLLEQLIEDGVIAKDLVMPNGNFRIETQIHCDEKACLFRCGISHDGLEIQEGPWGPIFQNLADETQGRTRDLALRGEVARRALETHLVACARVDQTLEKKGNLVSQTRARRPYLLILGTIAFLAVIAAGLLYWFEWRPGETATLPAMTVPASTATRQDLASEVKLSEEVEVHTNPEIPLDAPAPAALSPSEGLSQKAGTSASPATPPNRKPPSVSRSKASTPRPKSEIEHMSETAPSVTRQELSVQNPPGDLEKSLSPVEEVLSPADYFESRLVLGNKLYATDEVHLTEVPSAYRDLQCFTSLSSSGETKQGVVLKLSKPSQLFVVHDGDVKHRPDWLGFFEQTGDRIKVSTTIKNNNIGTYLIYRRDFPVGTVALGANTGARTLTRVSKRFSKRETLMYLVCIPQIHK